MGRKNAPPPSRGRPGRGVLTIVALLLTASAAVRLGTGTAPAIAKEWTQTPEGERDQMARLVPGPDDLAEMLAVLQSRDAELTAREEEIAVRLQAISEAEATLRQQMLDLVTAEEALRATLALAEGASETDLARLTAVYENMKPKEAAALFEEMEPDFAAGFIARMRSEAAAGVMAGLSPGAAYSISAVLAGRHMNVPTQ